MQDIPIPEQDIVVEEQELPQTNTKLEMGAAAADIATPPLLRQIPSPTPSETVSDNGGSVPLSPLLTQIVEAFAQVMKEEMRKMRGEMQQVGRCLQAGKMATPRAGSSELGGSATAVRPAVAAGEDRAIRETCWARRVKVTEEVTVTVREKLKGVTETCETRHVETTERIKCTETREIEKIEERLHGKDGVGDAHTHKEVVEDNGEGSQSVWRPGAGSGMASFGNGGRRCAPLKRVATRWVRSCRASLRGGVLRTGA